MVSLIYKAGKSMAKFQAITKKQLNDLSKDYLKNEKARVIRNALTENDISTISRKLEGKADNPNYFSIDVETLPVNN